MPVTIGRSAYGTVTADIFAWNGNAIEKSRDRSVTSGIRQWDNYVNNGEYIFLAIQGQVEPSLWDQTKDDT